MYRSLKVLEGRKKVTIKKRKKENSHSVNRWSFVFFLRLF